MSKLNKSKTNKSKSKPLNIYQKLGVFIIALFVLVFVALIGDKVNGGTNGQYTAEQMSHDHNGDGIPDH